MRPRFPLFESWDPHELGASLPIAGRLRRWALGLALAWLAVAAVVVGFLDQLGRPGTDPAEPAYVRQVVSERLARTDLPVWAPGGELPEVPPPELASPPPPPLTLEPHPADRPVRTQRLGRAVRALEEGEPLSAANELAELAQERPDSWMLAYDAGLTFLAAGFHRRAAAALEDALDRLEAYAPYHPRDPEHHAAAVVTRYASGLAERREDCVGGIRDLKLAIRDLRRFVDAGGARAFDRRLPYPVDPHGVSNLDVWTALVETYLQCDGRYPEEYFRRFSDASSFRRSEYGDPGAADVREGPFPRELAACIESDGARSRCWAVSNLNALYLANRSLLERPRLPATFEPHRDGLARLAYDVALVAATGPDAENAPEVLLQARRLGPSDPDLAQRIDALARHLGGRLQDYRVLAERFRGRGLEDMAITPETPDDDLKGMAWALREGWQRHLAEGAPERVFQEVAEARQHLPAAYLDSLEEWEADARATLRTALADEIRIQKRRGNRAMAAGLRDFRADWLGDAWPDRAEAAWWTWGLRAAWWSLVAFLVLLLAALAYLYRYAVYPYVLYTADFYRPEIERRERERRDRELPVTGQEMYELERRRRGGGA